MCLYLVFAQRRTAHSSSEALEDDEAHLCFCARPHSVSVFHPVFIGLRLQGGKARVNIARPPHSWCLTFRMSGRSQGREATLATVRLDAAVRGHVTAAALRSGQRLLALCRLDRNAELPQTSPCALYSRPSRCPRQPAP